MDHIVHDVLFVVIIRDDDYILIRLTLIMDLQSPYLQFIENDGAHAGAHMRCVDTYHMRPLIDLYSSLVHDTAGYAYLQSNGYMNR
jgi:hypothetical protein